MKKGSGSDGEAILLPVLLLLVSCASDKPSQQDLINDPFPEVQAEIHEVIAADQTAPFAAGPGR